MASKLTPRKPLECQRNGKYSRKAICSGHGLGAMVLLSCCVGMVLFCFMFVDMTPFYDSKGLRNIILQRDSLGTRSSSSPFSMQETEVGTVTPRTDFAIGLDTSDVAASNPAFEVANHSMKLADGDDEPAVNVDTAERDSKESVPYLNTSIRNESEEPQSESQARSEEPQAETQLEYQSEESQAESQAEVLAMPGNDRNSLAGCDLSHGKWVYDNTYPLYRSRNCPFVDTSFRCEENGRPDQDFMKYRWRPHDCDMPRFNARDMLERLRNQRLLFVGDSLGRNQWESMLCMLSEAVHDKSTIYEVHGKSISKHMGEIVFRFRDYNCTVEYFRDPFLVPQVRPPPGSPKNVTSVLKIDEVSWSAKKWRGANIMIFNSGHWWSWEKIGRPGGRFYMKHHLTEHSNEAAFKTGLETWALWMERNLDPATQVFFRSFASVHFRGGTWNRGGHCHEEVKPLTDEEVEKEQPVPWTNKHIKAAINKNIKLKRSAVEFMDVTTLTNYRADAHAGLYGKDTKIHGLPPKHRQDCSHFCLPGVPDTWNEVLYASLLARGQGVWAEPPRS